MAKLEENALSDASDGGDLPLDSNFIEQAEYISEQDFLLLNAEHPDQESIVRRLSASGAKLLVGPRGCGKTTLMLRAFYSLLRDTEAKTLPVYVNFKLSLKLEPLYVNTSNATFWFRIWLSLKIYSGIVEVIKASDRFLMPQNGPSADTISSALASIEAGRIERGRETDAYSIASLSKYIADLLSLNHLSRCILLLDDAAHAFSPRQQEDFFEFFRQIKSREISPKAAVYPGITTHSPTFHAGHDAESIDVWIRPDRPEYVEFMQKLAAKRFGGTLPEALTRIPQAVEFLAYASFGIPRSFLNMLRTVYHDDARGSATTTLIDRRRLLDIAKMGREASHTVYDSLSYKLPMFADFVNSGRSIYQGFLETLKEHNRIRDETNQALEIGLKRTIPGEIEKVIGFLQYAGLLMPMGDNSRGVKGVFELYMVHFGDLVTENAIIGKRNKSLTLFVRAFSAQTHQAWPRITASSLVAKTESPLTFRLALPQCQNCGADRVSEHAKFCQNCAAQLKDVSLYDELTNQDICVLPISKKMVERIKNGSSLRSIKDILIDTERLKLRNIDYIGPVRAARIANLAEEHVA